MYAPAGAMSRHDHTRAQGRQQPGGVAVVAAHLSQRPPSFGSSLNILLISSDSRSGDNGAIGGRGASTTT